MITSSHALQAAQIQVIIIYHVTNRSYTISYQWAGITYIASQYNGLSRILSHIDRPQYHHDP